MKWVSGGVTAAKGFKAAGLNSGIKKSRKPDLSLVLSAKPSSAAGVFTKNTVQAAPVLISKKRLKKGKASGVLINSGCANCLTGPAGMRDALLLGELVSDAAGMPDSRLLIGSTGIIGRRIPVNKVKRSIGRLIGRLSDSNHEAAAQAILTTDLRAKEAAVEAVINGRLVRVGGMAKGAGMIAPSMATMLCVLTTDASVSPGLLRKVLQQAVGRSFNRISVDGDMSTNDSVFFLANGASKTAIRPGTRAGSVFIAMVEAVCRKLAFLIVQDGEGAGKLMEIKVAGARNQKDADSCARQIAFSPLVKTMLAGSDPNVGRLAAAAGASNARFNPDHLEIHVSGVKTVSRGVALNLSKAVLRRLLNRPVVPVRVDLHAGNAAAAMWTCDLTAEYVRINAGYAT